MEGDSVRSYAADVSDPWHFVLNVLLQQDRETIRQSGEPVILAAAELTPTVVTYLDRARVLAVITEKGGRFSHGAVLTRSLGIPYAGARSAKAAGARQAAAAIRTKGSVRMGLLLRVVRRGYAAGACAVSKPCKGRPT